MPQTYVFYNSGPTLFYKWACWPWYHNTWMCSAYLFTWAVSGQCQSTLLITDGFVLWWVFSSASNKRVVLCGLIRNPPTIIVLLGGHPNELTDTSMCALRLALLSRVGISTHITDWECHTLMTPMMSPPVSNRLVLFRTGLSLFVKHQLAETPTCRMPCCGQWSKITEFRGKKPTLKLIRTNVFHS